MKVRLTKLTGHNNIEVYLTNVDCIVVAYEMTRDIRVYELAPQFSGRAQQAYGAMIPQEAGK